MALRNDSLEISVLVTGLVILMAIGGVVFVGGHYIGGLDCPSNACKPPEIAKAVSDARTIIMQFFLAIGTAGTLYFTWRSYLRAVAEGNEARSLTREARASDNFIKAVDQLGNVSLPTRVGGIAGLDRLLRIASDRGEYWIIMDVLTSYIRGAHSNGDINGSTRFKAPEDLQMACNALARRWQEHVPTRGDDSAVDLHESDLSGVWLEKAHFEGAYLERCNLSNVIFNSCSLYMANLQDTNLAGNVGCRYAYVRTQWCGSISSEEINLRAASGNQRRRTNKNSSCNRAAQLLDQVIVRTASTIDLPWPDRTSTCRNFETISSGL